MRRVVVTGLGILTPLGLGVDINWKRIISGFVGINKINNFDVSDLPCKTNIGDLIMFNFFKELYLSFCITIYILHSN